MDISRCNWKGKFTNNGNGDYNSQEITGKKKTNPRWRCKTAKPHRLHQNRETQNAGRAPQDDAPQPSVWFEGQRERWCQSSPTILLHSAYLQLWLQLEFMQIKGWKTAEGLPLSLSRSSESKVSGVGRFLSWSGDRWIWTSLQERGRPRSVRQYRRRGWHSPPGSSKLPAADSSEREEKAERESQKEATLLGQRPGSQRAKTHMARRDEVLVKADFKSTW